jgi:tetratricopeptide (TPR) repeat protein
VTELPETMVAPPAPATAADGARRATLRLARVHLRLGSLSLARAELEALRNRDALDEDGLLDLAEARWRTGDLAAAGEAASAVVDRGRDDTVALVIAAEARAAEGRAGEARRLAQRALADLDAPLELVFAGMPRSSIWPGEDADGATPVTVAATGAGVAASPAAAEAYAGGQAALAAGDSTNAALRLGVAVRLEPGFAQAVVDAVGPRPADPALALLAGDALRLLGRETEARAAFDVARGASPAPAADPAADPDPEPDLASVPKHDSAPEPDPAPAPQPADETPAPAPEPVAERGDPSEG